MNVILGFGDSETKTARKIIQECLSAIKKAKGELPANVIKPVEKKYHKTSDEYDKMSRSNAPERYSRFWAYESGGYIKFTFHHINRRHPFSPDGWALLKTNWILDIETEKMFHET